MKTNLTIFGLDRVGVSLGLVFAKKAKENPLVGWDADPKKLDAARDQNAFARLTSKLEEGVKFADLLLVDLPKQHLLWLDNLAKGNHLNQVLRCNHLMTYANKNQYS